MRFFKAMVRIAGVSCLLVVALFSTFYTFSGVSAATLSEWVVKNGHIQNEEALHTARHTGYKIISLQRKAIPFVGNAQKAMSYDVIESEPLTLEEAIDWTQYPSQTVLATGYTAGPESTGKTPDHPGYGITFSGVEVKRDLYSTIAADPSVFPIGSVLFIPWYGYGVVADTGSAIKGNKIDLYYETVQDVYDSWGKKEVEVFVIKTGEGNLTEEELTALNENEAVQVFRSQIK